MTEPTNPLPADQLPQGGGSYTRLPDGSLQLDEAPAATDAPAEDAVQTPIEGGAKAPRSRVKEA